ncbi:MAG: hypothetical protein H8E26_15605 [FCB group bacterium]|nr:hypothetical protein [FCB group bacterium]
MEAQKRAMEEVHPVRADSADNHITLFNQDPEKAYEEAQHLVNIMASRCKGPGYLVNIKGRVYPRIEWWASVSASLGLFPRTVFARNLDRELEIAYEAKVEVCRNGQVISSGEAMCSSKEARWENAPEYAIKSMAITRASGKAYRIPLSFLAVMAGLEATPAEEVTPDVINNNDKSDIPATDKQVERLGSLLNDDRLTLDEVTKLRGALLNGLSKEKASEIMSYFFGKSEKQGDQWVKITDGVLTQR